MCIGPLSTLTTNRAMRMSRINCSREVRLVRSTQFSGVSILRRDCPSTTRRVGASAQQNPAQGRAEFLELSSATATNSSVCADALEFAAAKEIDVIHIRISTEQRGEFGIN